MLGSHHAIPSKCCKYVPKHSRGFQLVREHSLQCIHLINPHFLPSIYKAQPFKFRTDIVIIALTMTLKYLDMQVRGFNGGCFYHPPCKRHLKTKIKRLGCDCHSLKLQSVGTKKKKKEKLKMKHNNLCRLFPGGFITILQFTSKIL